MSKTETDSTPEDKGGPGRKKLEFTDEQKEMIKRLSEVFCSQEEIAYVMGISRSVLRNHKDLLEEGKARGRVKLRRAQMEKALEGNPTMLIWLGKQMLGQTDNPGDSGEDLVLPWEVK
jgi:DNA-binding CsgD family transcriptional regulator